MLPSRRIQLTAVLLLIILLFPVISVTDDLMSTPALAETEHAVRLGTGSDLIHRAMLAVPSVILPSLLGGDLLGAPASVATARATLPGAARQLRGVIHPADSRPPPFTSAA